MKAVTSLLFLAKRLKLANHNAILLDEKGII